MTRDDINTIDLAALDLAVDLTLGEADRDTVKTAREKLSEDWFEGALHCADHRQCEHLSLRPWETSPACLDPAELDSIIASGPQHNSAGTARLLKKMLAAGISKYDPSPIDTLALIKRNN